MSSTRTTSAPGPRAEVIPSRWDVGAAARMQAALAALGDVRGVALELSVAGGQARLAVRAASGPALARVTDALTAHHPQLVIRGADHQAHPDADPLHLASGEGRAALRLRLVRPAAFPLRAGPAPPVVPPAGPRGTPPAARPPVTEDGGVLADLIAAALHAGPGQRVVVQLVLAPAPATWSARLAARLDADRRPPPRAPSTMAAAPLGGVELLPLLALAVAGGLGLRGYLWYRDGEWLPLAALGAGVAVGLPPVAAVVAWLLASRERPEPALGREKLTTPPFRADLRVLALGAGDEADLAALAHRVAAAFTALDHPAGNRLRPQRRHWSGDPRDLAARRAPWERPLLLSAAEIAAIWQPAPALSWATPAERARRLLPAAGAFARGGRVGVTAHQRVRRPVQLPAALLARHHLIVARTRRGKSTLLLHLARAVLEGVAAGGERGALVVLDPHQDLAEAVLGSVPAALTDRVTYLNLADRDHPIAINLLDPDLFPDRDRTAEHLVAMLHRLWPDNWGPRMEGALRAALMALHEANSVRPPQQRYTLLDVTPFLTAYGFREDVLGQVRDLALHAWWHDTYATLPRALQQQIATPVTTKIGRFLVGEAARLVVGQPRSTLDVRRLLSDGGALVVNAAAGRLGEGGAALLGATVLNLVGLLAEEQVALPPERRTRVVALVDEASTLAAADYPRMLSEFGKYGLSVVLVTQSLAKLDAIDRQLRPTVLANVDALTVFGVSAEDARVLAPELGPELAPEDLTDLDDYTCYARWWSAGRRPAPFSFVVDPPPPVDRERVAAIAAHSAARAGRPRQTVLAEIEELLRHRRDGRLTPAGARPAGADDRDADDPDAGGPAGNEDRGAREPAETEGTAGSPIGQGQLWDLPAPAGPRRRSHARSNAAKRGH